MAVQVGEQVGVSWTIIVPVKGLPTAKSRLMDATGDPGAHANLVQSIRADTLASAAAVGEVLLVCDLAPATLPDWPFLIQRRPGLNSALEQAAAAVQATRPGDGVAALVGDLPALRADELAAALSLASQHPRAFVADASGLGTTLLTAMPGVPLRPRFGRASARRHAEIGFALPAGAGLRLDVDTAADLAGARELGVGPATTLALGW